MHARRLVKSGASSYTISLPKEWLSRNKLTRGNLLYIKEDSANKLSITPERIEEKPKLKEITISIDDKKLDAIERELTSAYINNYSSIVIIGSKLIDQTKGIRRILHEFSGLEIIEQTSTRIIAKDFLDLKEISINSIIKRMDMIIRSMTQDLVDNIKNKNLYEDIELRDVDVNRLYFLLYRLIKGALNDPIFASHFEIDNTKILSLWYLIINLENTADAYKNICLSLKSLNSKSKKFEFGSLERLYQDIRSSYLDVMKAYYTLDKKLADNTASRREDIIKRCIPVSEKNPDFDTMIIYENLKEIEDFICNIARIVIDESM